MNPNELRIGNIVDIINRDNEIHLPMGVKKQIGEIGLNYVRLYDIDKPIAQQRFSLNIGVFDLSPIKLTDEIFIKSGLIVEKDHYIDEEYKMFTHEELGCEFSFRFVDGFYYLALSGELQFEIAESFKVEYLHQLQNLFFALTYKELQIKL